LLELGHSVIELRALMRSLAGGPASPMSPVSRALAATLQALAAWLATPREDTRRAAVFALQAAGQAVHAGLEHASGDAAGGNPARLAVALADLHSIHTSLLDQAPQRSPRGNHDAA
jgi:hypothetical protein